MKFLLLQIVDKFFLFYMLLITIRILSSWFQELSDQPFIRFTAYCTDPYLDFFRTFIPPLGMLDISPIVAFFFLQLIENIMKNFILKCL